MVEGKWLPPGADIGPALFLRREILSMDRDEKDDLAWQVLALNEGQPVGTGRIWWEDGAFHIGMIGVLPGFRSLGFGDFLTRLLLFKAQQHNAAKVILHTAPGAAPFFERYGFALLKETDSDSEIRLELQGQDIMLDTCQGCKKNGS
jgi:ribosomal protein S18 acetylase RimI-like enzyme